jgi:hypothetical protein
MVSDQDEAASLWEKEVAMGSWNQEASLPEQNS